MPDTIFAEKVYAAVKRIPKGRVVTYGQIADIIGCSGGARAVGNALHRNPYAPIVPCHRVVAADGSLAENFGCGGIEVQYARLKEEGVVFSGYSRSSRYYRDYSVSEPHRVDLARCGIVIERHPLEPFLPENGQMLFLGSFPPPKARWSMEFFYPNWINDFWRIQGLIHFRDDKYFEKRGEKCFDRSRIIEFCNKEGLAFYDTATKVCRWKGNASDEFLEILEPADIPAMLTKMPLCKTIVTTGGKSAEELLSILQNVETEDISRPLREGKGGPPAIGSFIDIQISNRLIRWWRMPSTSRAYPMSLQKKAEYYAKLWLG